jgi:hypothetical protein
MGSARTITILPFFVDGGASTHEFSESSRLTVLRAWLKASDLFWGNVFARGYPGSPGSGGASPYPELRSCAGASSVCSKIAHEEEQELETELILVIGTRNVLCGARQQFG